MEPKKPDWFLLIKAWLQRGRYGLTLPFLVRATAYHRGKSNPKREDIVSLINEIIENPVEGYIVHVRWCLEYGSAVFAVHEQNSPNRLRDRIIEIKNKNSPVQSLVIEQNLGAVWNVPAEKQSLLTTVIEKAAEPVVSGNFSRNWSEDGVQFEPLQKNDIEFIQEALGKKSS